MPRMSGECLVAALIASTFSVRHAIADIPYMSVYCGPLLALTPASQPGERLSQNLLAELHRNGELPFPAATVLFARNLHIVLSAPRLECFDLGCEGVAVVVVDGKTITSDDFHVGPVTPLEISRGGRDNDDCEPGSVLPDSWNNFTIITPDARVDGYFGVGILCDDIIADKYPGRTKGVGGWKIEMRATRPDTYCSGIAEWVGATSVATEFTQQELRRRVLREEGR